MALRKLTEDPTIKLQSEMIAIEKDPRFMQLMKEYKCKTINIRRMLKA